MRYSWIEPSPRTLSPTASPSTTATGQTPHLSTQTRPLSHAVSIMAAEIQCGEKQSKTGRRTVTRPHPVNIRLDNSGAHDARCAVDVVHVGKRFGENLPPRHMR